MWGIVVRSCSVLMRCRHSIGSYCCVPWCTMLHENMLGLLERMARAGGLEDNKRM
jgi:hypothetical protein